MASQNFIIAGENAICALTPTIQNLISALEKEIESNAGADQSGCYRENADCWGTLGVNTDVLTDNLRELAYLITLARKPHIH